MEKTVNTTNTLSTENIIRTFAAALDTLNDLANTGIIDEEVVLDAYPLFAHSLRDFLSNKYLAYVLNDCRTGEYGIYIFNDHDDCQYFLDGIISECREITIDEFEELAPYDWDNLSKYKKTADGTMVFRNFPD